MTGFGGQERSASSNEGSWEESKQCWTLQSGFLPLPNQQAAPLHPQHEFWSCSWNSARSPKEPPGHCLPKALGKGPGAKDSPGKGRPRGKEARVGAGWDSGRGDRRGTFRDLGREGTQVFSSSFFFEVSLWFEFNFDFLNFSRLKLK